ncbi:hypothetical protein LO762_07030 [Actinocorallia sp. API 0066]|uniref:hypothetical protein n=1 Tax=Actinocorallia sp. API 0066 TaxID=2896846 RepID=UPI001E5D6D6D|nr:hypothetical protein [Actinocorallia sp. API 0066]MCD0448943.1 hypothetical protein [Actinocorallia sp. API 0066]
MRQAAPRSHPTAAVLLSAAAVLTLTLLWWPSLPAEPVVVWDASGSPLHTVPRPLFLALPLAACLTPALYAHSPLATWSLALLVPTAQLLTLHANHHGPEAANPHGLASLACALLLATAVTASGTRRGAGAVGDRWAGGVGRHQRAETEWASGREERGVLVVGLALVVLEVGARLGVESGWEERWGFLVLGVVGLAVGSARVRASRDGVVFAYGVWGVPWRRYRLEAIAAAHVEGPSRRGRQRLVLTLRDGRRRAIRVADAAAGAEAVTALRTATRRRRAVERG